MRVGVANQQRRHSSGLSTCESLEASRVRQREGKKKEREKRMLGGESEKKKRDL